MIADKIQIALGALKSQAGEFVQLINSLDGKYDMRESEIKTLELQIQKLKEERESNQNKANQILQEANEYAAGLNKQAKRILEEAEIAKMQAKEEQEKGIKLKNEADAALVQANQRQKEADTMYRTLEDRHKKITEAMR